MFMSKNNEFAILTDNVVLWTKRLYNCLVLIATETLDYNLEIIVQNTVMFNK